MDNTDISELFVDDADAHACSADTSRTQILVSILMSAPMDKIDNTQTPRTCLLNRVNALLGTIR